MLVGGEAGVGKTRLVDEFVAHANAEGAQVLLGQCLELGEEGLPFAPFAGALREVLRREGTGPFTGHEQEFARLLPELGEAADLRVEPLPAPLKAASSSASRGAGAPGALGARAARHRGPALGRPLQP